MTPGRQQKHGTRQIYASIQEDLYLAAKARASELRIPLREFIELALEQALGRPDVRASDSSQNGSPWETENLKSLLSQPSGAPISLTPGRRKPLYEGLSAQMGAPTAGTGLVQGPGPGRLFSVILLGDGYGGPYLSSTLILDYVRGDSGAKKVVDQIIQGSLSCSFCPVTLVELWQVDGLTRKDEIVYQALLGFLEEVTLSWDSARTAGLWLSSLPKE